MTSPGFRMASSTAAEACSSPPGSLAANHNTTADSLLSHLGHPVCLFATGVQTGGDAMAALGSGLKPPVAAVSDLEVTGGDEHLT
jgi:hypothetical protein